MYFLMNPFINLFLPHTTYNSTAIRIFLYLNRIKLKEILITSPHRVLQHMYYINMLFAFEKKNRFSHIYFSPINIWPQLRHTREEQTVTNVTVKSENSNPTQCRFLYIPFWPIRPRGEESGM